ncbi:hypothetical protein SAMN04515674_104270 [Pseudarcicella hirudinis]|uniref:Uncharacterized protein n=1 Tax=Pseudarcicella hirudinis TaxID=1079859 RepID=A0A1I5RVC8_9BACT|nr:hypothetical protein SAMN04515674_104270 [Pseudarcicella hirudinis]
MGFIRLLGGPKMHIAYARGMHKLYSELVVYEADKTIVNIFSLRKVVNIQSKAFFNYFLVRREVSNEGRNIRPLMLSTP